MAWIAFSVVLSGALSGVLEQRLNAGKGASSLSGMPKVSTVKGDSQGETGGFRYLLSDVGTALLKGYTGSESDITLPMLIEGHLVTGMTQSAFSGDRHLRRVQVPATVRAISNGAFAGCIALREVVLSDGVQAINAMAFALCPSLKDVTIPASVTAIGVDAFPEDCAATFHVAADSFAERYCREKGFAVETGA